MQFLHFVFALLVGIAASVAIPDPMTAVFGEQGAQYPVAGWVYGNKRPTDEYPPMQELYVQGFWMCQGVTSFRPSFASVNRGFVCQIYTASRCDQADFLFQMKSLGDYVMDYGDRLWFKCQYSNQGLEAVEGSVNATASEGA